MWNETSRKKTIHLCFPFLLPATAIRVMKTVNVRNRDIPIKYVRCLSNTQRPARVDKSADDVIVAGTEN